MDRSSVTLDGRPWWISGVCIAPSLSLKLEEIFLLLNSCLLVCQAVALCPPESCCKTNCAASVSESVTPALTNNKRTQR